MVAEKFNIMVNITGKYICKSSFLFMPPSKTLLQVFIITPQAEGNYPFLPNIVFWRSIFFPAERGGRENYGGKNTKIKPARVLVTSFEKYHHLWFLFRCAVI